jgi:hypothetical protein
MIADVSFKLQGKHSEKVLEMSWEDLKLDKSWNLRESHGVLTQFTVAPVAILHSSRDNQFCSEKVK